MTEKKQRINNNQRIISLQAIKTIAFLMIFFSHTRGFLYDNLPDLGARAVELFIIISGFTMIYNHFYDYDKKSGKELYIDKFKKFYNVHLITFVIMIPYEIMMFDFIGFKQIVKFIVKFFSNILLLQSWIPKSSCYFSFNTVSWYISTILFCYLCTPLLIRLLKQRFNTKKRLLLLTILIFLIKFIVELFSWRYLNGYYGFITHLFPLYRCLDYFLGMICGVWFILYKRSQSKYILSLKQLLFVIIYITFVVLFKDNYLRVIYFPIIMLLIYYMSFDYGLVCFCLKNKFLIKLEKISLEFFMTHMIVVSYYTYYLQGIIDDNILSLILIFILSIFFSYILKIFLLSISQRNKMKQKSLK